MKTEILDIFKIAQKIASIAENETKKVYQQKSLS